MSSPASISPPARTWRDIPQTIAPRAMSSTGRQRMILATVKSVTVLVLVCASLWGGYEIYQTWESNPAKIKAPVKSSPVKTISLRGQNLTLDQPWVVRTLALAKNADLMELDLYALRERLMATGQVKTAELTRKFPDTLVVSLEERSPVARINVRFGEGEPETFLVARDGTVYRGECYKDEIVQGLPFLGGIGLKRTNGKLLPIEGMDTVANLLDNARANTPSLYRNWAVISLAKFASDGQIVVQTTDMGEVIFGTQDDFFKQLARLDYILTDMRSRPTTAAQVKTINLAVDSVQVPILFEQPALPATPEHGATTSAKPSSARVASAAPTHQPSQSANLPHFAPTRPLQASTTTPHRTSRRDF